MQVVGRDEELAAVRAFLERVPEGPCALQLEGAAGMGKTTVWQAGVAAARSHGLPALESRAAQAESTLGFGAVIDLLAPVARDVLPALPAPQRAALAVALLLEDAEGPPPQQKDVSVAVLGALRLLAARGPILLALDDVQWLDAASAQVLAYALRRLRNEPVGVLASRRTGEPTSFALEKLRPDTELTRIELPGLSLGSLHHLVRERLGVSLTRPALSGLTKASGGNPFFALEIVRHGERRPDAALPVPRGLRELVGERLSTLEPAARDAVLVTYALARPARALVEEATDGLLSALAAGVVDLRGDLVELDHPLVGSVLYEELDGAARRALHARLAQLAVNQEEQARHLALAAAEPDETVAAALEDAAGRARARGATDAATELLQLAVDLTPEPEQEARLRRELALAQDEYMSGRAESARERLQRVVEASPAGPARARAIWLAATFGGTRGDGADELLESAVAEAGEDAGLRSGIAMTLARSAWWSSDLRGAAEHAAAAVAFAEEARDRAALAPALAQLAIVHFYLGLPWEDALERAIRLEKELEGALPVEVMPSLFRGTIYMTLCEDADESIGYVLELRRRAQERGDGPGLASTSIGLCTLATKTGRYAEAREHVHEGQQVVKRTEADHLLDSFDYLDALVAAHEGQADEARLTLTRVVEKAAAAGTLHVENQARQVLGFLEISAGNAEAAVEWLIDLHGRYTAMEYAEPNGLRFVPDLVEAFVGTGRFDEAEAILAPFEENARRLERRWAGAAALRCRGLLQAATGDAEAAAATLDAAVTASEPLPQPLELGRALLERGIVARRAKQKRIADEALGRAEELFARLGAGLWLERARAERSRVGLRPRAPESLTETEHRVAELAAAGRRNGEIATELFMSVRAVEANLTRAYRKLGIRSRSELASKL